MKETSGILKPIVKQALRHYIGREMLKVEIRRIFFKHYTLAPMSAKKNSIKRNEVYNTIRDELRMTFGFCSTEFRLMRETLVQLGLREAEAAGCCIFKGLMAAALQADSLT